MRILHAVHNYPPEFRGGIERVVESLVAAQVARGHSATVLAGSETSADAPAIRRETHDGVPVLRLLRGRGLRDPIDPFRAELGGLVETALAEARPEVLHVHHWFNLGSDLVRRAARRGVPSVVTLHDFYATCGLFFRLPDGATPCDLAQAASNCVPCIEAAQGSFDAEELAFRVTMRRSDLCAELSSAAALTAPSESHARSLLPHLPDGVRIEAVPPGSPSSAPAPRSAGGGPLRILHFGNLCRVKGVEFLIRALRVADPAGIMMQLVLAGPVVEAGLRTDGASLAGPFDAARLRSLAADADVAAFPSFARESYSLVVDEALRLGLPVLVSDRGALSERIGGRGMVLPAGDEKAWAAALAGLAREPAALERMRAAPHRPLSTPEEHAEKLLAVYASARIPGRASIDLETPLLSRLAHFEERLGDLVHMLSRQRESG
jgi:glycosyltransferase involved in cell wall biosynthesis